MFFRNTSSHPTDEVRALIALAAEPYDLRRVCVNVKGTRHSYRGRAYAHVPRAYSNAPRTAKHLVVIAVGKAESFAEPVTNMRTTHRWIRMDADEIAPLLQPVRPTFGPDGKVLFRSRLVSTTTPYGGSKSPLVTFHDWREAMVGIAAHEFHHIQQFQNKARCVEAYCERAAAAALERYRALKNAGSL